MHEHVDAAVGLLGRIEQSCDPVRFGDVAANGRGRSAWPTTSSARSALPA
jgi:hypothetical protein